MTSENANPPADPLSMQSSTIAIPRWVVYFQAAMLGIIATTFFIFGLMVGSFTSGNRVEDQVVFDCAVSGTVQRDEGDKRVADAGAVVFLLPKNGNPDERAAGSSVSPDGFEPLNNPGVEIVNRLGGAVVRTDEYGNFDVVVDASDHGIEYYLLVVSRNATVENQRSLTKLQVAVIGTYYLPVERVMDNQAIYWSTVKARRKQIELPTVEF